MDQCIAGRSVSGVLQPHVRLQLDQQSLDNEALLQQELVHQGHEVVLHIAASASDQVEAALPELLHHLLGDIALITKYLALEASSQCCQGCAAKRDGGHGRWRP